MDDSSNSLKNVEKRDLLAQISAHESEIAVIKGRIASIDVQAATHKAEIFNQILANDVKIAITKAEIASREIQLTANRAKIRNILAPLKPDLEGDADAEEGIRHVEELQALNKETNDRAVEKLKKLRGVVEEVVQKLDASQQRAESATGAMGGGVFLEHQREKLIKQEDNNGRSSQLGKQQASMRQRSRRVIGPFFRRFFKFHQQ